MYLRYTLPCPRPSPQEREKEGRAWQPRWYKALPADAEVFAGEYSNEECPQFDFTGEWLKEVEEHPRPASDPGGWGPGGFTMCCWRGCI